jgi:hypothetical protein
MRVLVSGGQHRRSCAGLLADPPGVRRHCVERTPELRKTGGHAVDLFRSAMDISEQMGVIPRIEDHATGIERLIVHRTGASRPVRVDYLKWLAAASDRHVDYARRPERDLL